MRVCIAWRGVHLGSNSCQGELTYFNAGLSIFFLPFLVYLLSFPIMLSGEGRVYGFTD